MTFNLSKKPLSSRSFKISYLRVLVHTVYIGNIKTEIRILYALYTVAAKLLKYRARGVNFVPAEFT